MKNCLVVDDSSVIRRVARHLLEDLGYRVTEAEHGQQALAICREAHPDLILLDGHMPVMDGLECVKKLRATAGGDRPKVIYWTTENDVAAIARALSAGADEYMMKPFDRDILESTLRQVGFV